MARTFHATNKNGRFAGWVLLALLSPSVCLANGWVSGVNAFRHTPHFYFIFAAIVLVESLVLWLWLKPVKALPLLGLVILLNGVSSLAGDGLFRLGWAPCSGTLWKQAVPFFFLTIALEGPLASVIFRRCGNTWNRTALAILSTNVASYALLMAIDRPVREAWLDGLRS